MTFTIPMWVLWTLGIGVGVPTVLVILFLAWLGYQFVKAFSGRFY